MSIARMRAICLAWLCLFPFSGNAVTPMIAAGWSHSVALKNNGTLVAVGSDYSGQLGWGRLLRATSPIMVRGNAGVTALAAGASHSLALTQDGTVWAWGSNNFGELGDGTTAYRGAPVQVSGLTGVTAVAAAESYSLALTQDGTVWAWGRNMSGQLGDGTSTDRHAPVQVSGLTGVTAIAAGDSHSLALKQDDTVWAWGSNEFGQLGDGTYVDRDLPVVVVNETVDGFLDLIPEIPNDIPQSAIPTIILEVQQFGGLSSSTLGANVYFGSINSGGPAADTPAATSLYKVYVAAIVPGAITGGTDGIYLLEMNRQWSLYSGGPLPEYESNVTLDATQHHFVPILDGSYLWGLIGARLLVGYGIDDQEMLAAQRYREIYVAQQPSGAMAGMKKN